MITMMRKYPFLNESVRRSLLIGVVGWLLIVFALLFAVRSAGAQELGTVCLSSRGSDSAFLKKMPWSGYWWSRREGKLAKGWASHAESPMQRYDRYVMSRTGNNPGAQAWEQKNHCNPTAPSWWGHCNGWAAASIMEPEPCRTRMLNGITFTVADQKALLSEMCMDVRALFYGNRQNDISLATQDIRPDRFHRLLIENIKKRGRGIVADTSWSRSVWNFPICGYETEWAPIWFFHNRVWVTTTVHFATDGVKPEFVGTETFTQTYHYILNLNDRGEVIGGFWDPRSLWSHPDFVWIPVADVPAEGGENPRLSSRFVHEITGAAPAVEPVLAMSEPSTESAGTADARLEALREAGVDPAAYFD